MVNSHLVLEECFPRIANFNMRTQRMHHVGVVEEDFVRFVKVFVAFGLFCKK